MLTKPPHRKRALRLSRPDTERFFTIMLVFSHRTFRWSLARKTLLWIVGGIFAVWSVAMIGSAFGLWASRKLMSFSALQRETQTQQRQIKESLEQSQSLEEQIHVLRGQIDDLLHLIDPKAKTPDPAPGSEIPQQNPKSAPGGGNNEKLQKLKADLDRTAEQARLVQARMAPLVYRWEHTPSVPPTAGYVSSGFGIRLSPFARANEAGDGLVGFHTGMDITNALGTPIQATANGTVEQAGWQEGYGLTVVIRHTRELTTLYAHLSRLRVQVGQQIIRGDILGDMGATGRATGVHCHYEVRVNERPVNPAPYLRLQRQWLASLK